MKMSEKFPETFHENFVRGIWEIFQVWNVQELMGINWKFVEIYKTIIYKHKYKHFVWTLAHMYAK